MESEAPVIRLVDRVIQDAVKARATDIHIEPAQSSVHVRYRIDGVLRDILKVPKYVQGPLLSRVKVMGNMDISDKRKPQDGRSKVKMGKRVVDLRISSLPTMFGEKIVIRLLEQKKGVISVGDIGFSPHLVQSVGQLIQHPQGMILVTGPTGSGKTTTLYSLLSRLNDGTTNIVTVEDPVEYQVPGINQVQIHVRAGMTFASGLRSILRQDPDVVLVGEMRDHETAEIAFHAAQTGHLVLSTLHTNDAASTVTRLLSMGIDPYLIASSVLGIMAQRLVRQLCPQCKVPVSLDEKLAKWVPKDAKDKPHQVFAPRGCKRCRDSGYYDRFPLAEVLTPNDTIRDLVLKGISDREILNVARKGGMKTIFEDGIDRVLQGLTTFEEVARVVAPARASSVKERTISVDRVRMKKALIVEDHPDTLQLLTMQLLMLGFAVVSANNGKEGVEKAIEETPQLILMDIMMPGMDGRDATRMIRSNQKTKDIPILASTVLSEELELRSCIEAGCNGFLIKPFTLKQLQGKVQEFIPPPGPTIH